jgi:hypothetical protein
MTIVRDDGSDRAILTQTSKSARYAPITLKRLVFTPSPGQLSWESALTGFGLKIDRRTAKPSCPPQHDGWVDLGKHGLRVSCHLPGES